MDDAERITAADMMRSLEIQEAIAARRRALALQEDASGTDPIEVAEANDPSGPPVKAENVTPLSVAERKRHDP
jgi:hypothetical protein